MAVVRNKTADVRSLFHSEAPPIDPGDEIELSNDRFVGLAWPKSTWDLVKKPGKGFTDASTEDAYIFLPVDTEEEGGDLTAPAPPAPSADAEENAS